MAEESKEVTSKIILDKHYWMEPAPYGWSLKYEKVNTGKKSRLNPGKETVSRDTWHPGTFINCLKSYVDKKLHNIVSEADEPYTPDEILVEMKIILKGLDKRFGYLRHIGAEDSI